MLKLLSSSSHGTAGSTAIVDRAITAWLAHYERLFSLDVSTGSR